MNRRAVSLLLLCQACRVSAFNPSMPLDRPYSLRNAQPLLLEMDYGRMIAGEGALGFIRPRPCRSPLDSSGACASSHHLRYGSDTGSAYLGLRLLGGEEFRSADDGVWATEAGGQLEGSQGPASFTVDARFFSESNGGGRPSFDREAIDNQNADVTGSVSYRSYSRYRGNIDLDLPFGRLSAGRDAAHWGPGLMGNLVFNQDAVPFDQVSYSTWLGPLSVISLYGDLAIGQNQAYDAQNREERSLYAHRYELRLGKDWLLGMSEQLILHGYDKPLLLIPIVPLFIAKGLLYEEDNNGNLAFDAAYRLPGLGMAYAELMVDDLESPSSLFFKDYIQNKWALLVGAHYVHAWADKRMGVVVEYTRIEPWVYTHFVPGTSQTANAGFPLGNQQGPDSRSLVGEVYGEHPCGVDVSARIGYYAKGRGPGSGLEDPFPKDGLERKGDFDARSETEWRIEPAAGYVVAGASFRAGGLFSSKSGAGSGAWARVAYAY